MFVSQVLLGIGGVYPLGDWVKPLPTPNPHRNPETQTPNPQSSSPTKQAVDKDLCTNMIVSKINMNYKRFNFHNDPGNKTVSKLVNMHYKHDSLNPANKTRHYNQWIFITTKVKRHQWIQVTRQWISTSSFCASSWAISSSCSSTVPYKAEYKLANQLTNNQATKATNRELSLDNKQFNEKWTTDLEDKNKKEVEWKNSGTNTICTLHALNGAQFLSFPTSDDVHKIHMCKARGCMQIVIDTEVK